MTNRTKTYSGWNIWVHKKDVCWEAQIFKGTAPGIHGSPLFLEHGNSSEEVIKKAEARVDEAIKNQILDAVDLLGAPITMRGVNHSGSTLEVRLGNHQKGNESTIALSKVDLAKAANPTAYVTQQIRNQASELF